MGFAPSSPRRRAWVRRGVFLLACLAFVLVRHGVEAQRERELAQWDRKALLTQKLWTVADVPIEQMMATLAPGKPIPAKSYFGPHSYRAELQGADISDELKDWKVSLIFSQHRDRNIFGLDTGGERETLLSWRTIAPAWLRDEPSPLWWGIERFRAAALWLSLVIWVAGVVLIASVRGIRRRVAEACIVAGLVCMLMAALDLQFAKREILHPFNRDRNRIFTGYSSELTWRYAVANHPAWFDAGGLLTIVALMIWIVPSRRTDSRHCATCRYDLTGNQSGICPECGTATPRLIRSHRLAELEPVADRLTQLLAEEAVAEADEASFNQRLDDPRDEVAETDCEEETPDRKIAAHS